MQSYRADTAACPYSCFTHYIRYYGIKPADDLRVTSYCDNESLLKNEEAFHTRKWTRQVGT
jgi:hypothetical protein